MDPIAPATNKPGLEYAIFGDLTKRRVMVVLEKEALRWVEVDGKQERGADAGEREPRAQALTWLNENVTARVTRATVERRVVLGRECVCGRMVPRRPFLAPFDARTGRLSTNAFCLAVYLIFKIVSRISNPIRA